MKNEYRLNYLTINVDVVSIRFAESIALEIIINDIQVFAGAP